jgi:hypothetical protein
VRCGHCGRAAQDRRHDGEVARGDDANSPGTSAFVELGIVARGQAAGADNHVSTGVHGRPDVVLDHVGAGVVDQHIDRCRLEGLRHGAVHLAVDLDTGGLSQALTGRASRHSSLQVEVRGVADGGEDGRCCPAGHAGEADVDHCVLLESQMHGAFAQVAACRSVLNGQVLSLSVAREHAVPDPGRSVHQERRDPTRHH